MSDRYRAELPYANYVSCLLSTKPVSQGCFLISTSERRSFGCHVRILLSRSVKSLDSVSEILVEKGSFSVLILAWSSNPVEEHSARINACGPSKWARFRKACANFAKCFLPDLSLGFRPLQSDVDFREYEFFILYHVNLIMQRAVWWEFNR